MSKFDWGSLGRAVAKLGAPLLGTALGGPAGGAIGVIVGNLLGVEEADNPEKIMAAIQVDPKAAAKLMQLQIEQKTRLEELVLAKAQAESQERINHITQVNLTMRAEAKSEHWPQWSWRPFNGFMFPLTMISVYVLLPILELDVPDVPEWIWILWASILGVATMGRNRQKNMEIAAVNGGSQNYGLIGQMIQAIKK